MFFSKLGRVFAYLAFVYGVCFAVFGFAAAFGMVEAPSLVRQYGSTGAIIDQGTTAIAVGVVLGILSEIGLRDRV